MTNIPTIVLPEVSLVSLLMNLSLGTILSFLIGWHYFYRSKKKMLRKELGYVLPVICLTTILVISVVKSSLALSLGLVGALSIVRFRTPIKEPEELAYIFLAIALGLALGADQREVAAIAVPLVLFVIWLTNFMPKMANEKNTNLFMSLEIPREKDRVSLESILDMVSQICPAIEIRKIHQNEELFTIMAIMHFNDGKSLSDFSDILNKQFPKGKFTFIDDSAYPND
jgi:hypothetical protein